MRLLILSNNAEGLYLFRKELIKSFIDNGYDVILAIPKDKREKELYQLGCKIYHVDLERRGKNPIHDLKLFLEYIRLIQYLNPDLILTYTIKPNLYGGIVSRILRKRYCTNITGLGTEIEREGMLSKVLLKFYHIALQNSECIFYQNCSNQKFFNRKGIKGKRQCLLPGSGVNLREYSYSPLKKEEQVNLLFVGRIMKEKGIEELLKVIPDLKRKYKNLNFHFIGDYEKEREEKYRKWVEELQEKSMLVYHGYSNEVWEHMEKATAIVHPSWHEGMSNVLLQAAAVGRPILASKIPGCKETFEEGKSGFGFEIKNIQSLQEAIIKFMELTWEERKQMGDYGRRKIEREFSRDIIIHRYQQLIDKIGEEKK